MKTHNHCGPSRSHGHDDSTTIEAGGKTYDLTTKKGKEAFERDIEDGKLDGKAGGQVGGCGDGVTFDRSTNTVQIGGKSYDMDNDKQRAAFQRDAADGFIDGKTTGDSRKKVTVGDKTYDLSTEKGKKQFEKDIEAGVLDVDLGGCGQVSYDRETNTLRAGDKTYDLDKPKEVKAFHADVNDGGLDGKDSRHLRNVQIGTKEYNLTTPEGLEAFENDCNSGDLGVNTLGCGGVEYNRETNSVRAGEKVYDLNDPKQVEALKADARDGTLDGVDSKHLKRFDVAGTRYDLTTEEGRGELAADFEGGFFGATLAGDASYDPSSNVVTVGHTTYDLNDPKQAATFRKDAADGVLDGEIKRNQVVRG